MKATTHKSNQARMCDCKAPQHLAAGKKSDASTLWSKGNLLLSFLLSFLPQALDKIGVLELLYEAHVDEVLGVCLSRLRIGRGQILEYRLLPVQQRCGDFFKIPGLHVLVSGPSFGRVFRVCRKRAIASATWGLKRGRSGLWLRRLPWRAARVGGATV